MRIPSGRASNNIRVDIKNYSFGKLEPEMSLVKGGSRNAGVRMGRWAVWRPPDTGRKVLRTTW